MTIDVAVTVVDSLSSGRPYSTLRTTHVTIDMTDTSYWISAHIVHALPFRPVPLHPA